MILLLFETRRGKLFPIHEALPAGSSTLPQRTEGRWPRLKVRVYNAYAAFQERFDYQETLCSHLRHASHLEIYHASFWSEAEARERFQDFLRRRRRKDAGWLWIDALLALLGSLLTPLPGPNVFFLYPAVRSFSHHLARKGTGRALRLSSISFRSERRIDTVQNQLDNLPGINETLQELEDLYNLTNLKSQLALVKK